jgi:hypothetical protein
LCALRIYVFKTKNLRQKYLIKTVVQCGRDKLSARDMRDLCSYRSDSWFCEGYQQYIWKYRALKL